MTTIDWIRTRLFTGVGAAWLAAGALGLTVACRVSEEDEVLLGQYQAAEVDSTVPMVTDTAVSTYIATLGRAMASHTSRADLDWHFSVANASAVNAFALPGGFVYFTRGLIEASDESRELTGVMAHEIAHVVLRHSVKQLEMAGGRNIAVLMLCTLTNACATLGGTVALRVGAEALTAQYSQKDEAEADAEGVRISLRAGMDPEGLVIFLQKVMAQRTDKPSPIDAFFSTHPTDESRIAALRRQIDATVSAQMKERLVRDTPEFHAAQERVRAFPEPPQTDERGGR